MAPEKTASYEELRNSFGKPATKVIFITIAYGIWMGIKLGGYFWLSSVGAFLFGILLVVGFAMRLAAPVKPHPIVFSVVGTLLLDLGILFFAAVTAYVAFKAGFYDLYGGIVDRNLKEIGLSLIALFFGWHLANGMNAIFDLSRFRVE